MHYLYAKLLEAFVLEISENFFIFVLVMTLRICKTVKYAPAQSKG
jgi:hypothetical protein